MRARHCERRTRPLQVIVLVTTLIACLPWLVACQKTQNELLLRKTLVNLHDPDLEENKDLDLSAEPVEAALQVSDRIGTSVRAK